MTPQRGLQGINSNRNPRLWHVSYVCVCVCVLSVRALRFNYFEAQEVWDHVHIVACVSALSSHITHQSLHAFVPISSYVDSYRCDVSPLSGDILWLLVSLAWVIHLHIFSPVDKTMTSCWLRVNPRSANLKGSFKVFLYRFCRYMLHELGQRSSGVQTKTCLKVIQDTVSIS